MDYQFLRGRGALSEADVSYDQAPPNPATWQVPRQLLELVPERIARENVVMPLLFDGETITFASVKPDDIALADRLRFLLAKNVRLAGAPREVILHAINHHYRNSREQFLGAAALADSDYEFELEESAAAQSTLPQAPAARPAAAKRSNLSLDSVMYRKGRGRRDLVEFAMSEYLPPQGG